ncbi:penicillin-binding transpeptidase domain-containing protein [Georgenia faecalis]|uniref:penicillin-binding transpeptidase domain-containing protein n=1 Tax=Georgenia faecalis TaxID=2483799 RepID=UPI000FDAFA72|nr:penicillin-binding transpeptidase domain-containing protein [Georgenia faecalis]
MTSSRQRPRAALLVTALLTTGVLAACSDPTDAIAQSADDLAAALEAGDASAVTWAGDAPDLAVPLGDLADLPRTVEVASVGEVEEDSDPRTADVDLRWAWDLDADGAGDWEYTSTATLQEDEDAWVAAYDPAVVAEGLSGEVALSLARTTGVRGEILAGDGTPVVTDRQVRRVGIDKTHFPEGTAEADVRASAEAVAAAAGLADPAAYADRVVAAGPRAFVEAIVVREESPDVDLAALEALTGAVALPDEIPLAPTPTWARPLLGRVGPATAEVVEASEGAIAAGDEVGLSGLQSTYDETLRGTPGLRVSAGTGEGAAVLFERVAVDGEDLALTLETGMQTAAEQALEATDSPTGLVAIRPSTGEILAVASGPGSEGQNTAMGATLAPGSTYKVVTALALLRAGVGPDATVPCTPEATVSGYTIGNYPEYPAAYLGDITLTQALAQSCNTALINAGADLTGAAMADAARSLGVGQELAGAWPAFTGSAPADAEGTGLAASLIGQGEVLASPLAMAVAAASISAGHTVTPTLVTGPEALADAPSEPPATPLTAEEAAALSGYMRAVVAEGTGILLADVPGEPIHAKTGSAEAGEGDAARVDSWMIAFRGDLAVAALVHGGGHGSGPAGAAVEAFLRTVGG